MLSGMLLDRLTEAGELNLQHQLSIEATEQCRIQ